jgi:secreted trypsin-like serine protease
VVKVKSVFFQYVLTAAHCIAWGKGALRLQMLIGDHNLQTSDETPSVVRKVRKIKMHASYNTTNTDYDVALIEMDEKIEFSDIVRPVCLALDGMNLVGKMGMESF